MNVEVVEVVECGSQGPASLNVVHLFGQLKHRAVLESEAVFEQTGDVRHVHAEEGADLAILGHLVAHFFGSLPRG